MLIYIVSFIVGTGYAPSKPESRVVEQANFSLTHFLNSRSRSPISY